MRPSVREYWAWRNLVSVDVDDTPEEDTLVVPYLYDTGGLMSTDFGFNYQYNNQSYYAENADKTIRKTFFAWGSKPGGTTGRRGYLTEYNHVTEAYSAPVAMPMPTTSIETDSHFQPSMIVADDGHILYAMEKDHSDGFFFLLRSNQPYSIADGFTTVLDITVEADGMQYIQMFKRNGVIAMISRNRYNYIYIRTSSDNGVTWGTFRQILQLGNQGANGDGWAYIYKPIQDENGEVFILVSDKAGAGGAHVDSYILRSEDFITWYNEDKTFSKNISISAFTRIEMQNNFSVGLTAAGTQVSSIYGGKFYKKTTVTPGISGVLIRDLATGLEETKSIGFQAYGTGTIFVYNNGIIDFFCGKDLNGRRNLFRFRSWDNGDSWVVIERMTTAGYDTVYPILTRNYGETGSPIIATMVVNEGNANIFFKGIRNYAFVPTAVPSPVSSLFITNQPETGQEIEFNFVPSLDAYDYKYTLTLGGSTIENGVFTGGNNTFRTAEVAANGTYTLSVVATNPIGDSTAVQVQVVVATAVGLNPKDDSIANELVMHNSTYEIISTDYVAETNKLITWRNTANNPLIASFSQATDSARPVFDPVNKKLIFDGTRWLRAGDTPLTFTNIKNNYAELFFVVRLKIAGGWALSSYNAGANKRTFWINSLKMSVWADDLESYEVTSGQDLRDGNWHTVFTWIKNGEIGIQTDKNAPIVNTSFTSIEKDGSVPLTIAGNVDDNLVPTTALPVCEISHICLYGNPSRNNKTDRDLMHDYFQGLGQV